MTTQSLADTIAQGCIEKHGVDPGLIYCLVTGKPVGESYEYTDLVNSLVGETDHLVDEVMLRVLASMRPSLRWNRMKIDTLNDMRVAAPIETMAYLLNRLLMPLASAKNSHDFMSLHSNRIQLFAKLSESWDNHAKEALDAVLLKLLEIESKLGLLTEESPITYAQLLDAERPLEAILGRLTKWHEERVKWHEAQEREARFFAANPGARKAMASVFWETKPKSEATVKREAVQKDRNVFGAILDELLSPGITATKPHAMRVDIPEVKATPRPKTVMPARFGVAKKAEV